MQPEMNEIKVNVGLVFRGDVVLLKRFLCAMDALREKFPTVQLVHKHVSASRLWVKEGDDMNDRRNDQA